MSKYLIINADDFGITDSVNKAIIDLLEKNKISSATLMPNGNSYDEAANWSSKNSEDIGVHLTFVNGGSNKRISSLTRQKSIEDKDGYLFEDKLYFIRNFKYDEIKKEMNAQFKKIIGSGVKISHVDTHRYSIYPTYSPFTYMYLCKKCGELGVPTRWCRKGSYYVGDKINNLCDSYPASQFFAAISDFYKVPIPDYVFKFPYSNMLPTYEEKKSAFLNMLNRLPDGINEVHIHPSIEGQDIIDITGTYKERIYEYELMLDEEIAETIQRLNIKLIRYSDINSIVKCSGKLKSICNIFYYGSKYVLKRILK